MSQKQSGKVLESIVRDLATGLSIYNNTLWDITPADLSILLEYINEMNYGNQLVLSDDNFTKYFKLIYLDFLRRQKECSVTACCVKRAVDKVLGEIVKDIKPGTSSYSVFSISPAWMSVVRIWLNILRDESFVEEMGFIYSQSISVRLEIINHLFALGLNEAAESLYKDLKTAQSFCFLSAIVFYPNAGTRLRKLLDGDYIVPELEKSDSEG